MKIALKTIKIDGEQWWRAFDAAKNREHIGGTGKCPAQAIGCMMISHAAVIVGPLEFEWRSKMPKNFQ